MPDNDKRMTPIRVPDMVWMEEDIRFKFEQHRQLFQRERDALINENLDKTIPKYTKSLGLTDPIAKLQAAYEKRRDFELTMDTQLDILIAKEAEIAQVVEDKINASFNPDDKTCPVREKFEIRNRYNDGTKLPEMHRLHSHIADMCRGEAEKAYELSPNGLALKTLNDAENACKQVLHSGYDITDARKFIDKTFKEVGIDSPIVTDINNGLAWDGNK